MSDDIHRFIFRWSGHDKKGLLKIGATKIELDRMPRLLRGWFDLWYSPPTQMEGRERACDEKRELSGEEIRLVHDFIRPIGALVRLIEDEVKG